MSALVLAAVLAATPITLDDARAEGRNNVQALQSLLDVEVAQGDMGVARSALLPRVDFSVSVGGVLIGRQRVFTTVPDPETGGFVQRAVEVPSATRGNYDLSLDLSQLLYDRARWKLLEQSGARVEATRGEALEQAATSELEAVRRFFDLYRSQATLDVLAATVRRSEEQLERARALFQAGRVGRGEELAAQVNLGNDRISLLSRQARLAVDQAQLAVWLARPGTSDLKAVDPGVQGRLPAPAPSLEEALEQARRGRPLLVALRQQLRVAQLGVDIAQAGYLPSLSGRAGYSRSGPTPGPVFTEPLLQNNLSGGVVLSWNLFEGFGTRSRVSQAEATVRRTQLTYEQRERELEAEVRRAVQALRLQLDAAQLAEDNRASAVQALTLAEERFRAGAGSTLEVRDAQLKLTQAELVLLENRIEVEVARFALMRAMGTLGPGESR